MQMSATFLFRQLFDVESSTYTYLLADVNSKKALLVDPVLGQVERDAAFLKELNLDLHYAINTHVHADYFFSMLQCSSTISFGYHGEQGKRPTMEDAHVALDDLWHPSEEQTSEDYSDLPACWFFGVYDGHGGKKAALFAASRLHNVVRQQLFENRCELVEGNCVKQCIRDAFEETEDAWATKAHRHHLTDGSTAITALILADRMYIANLGDSPSSFAAVAEWSGSPPATTNPIRHPKKSAYGRPEVSCARWRGCPV